MKNRRISYLKSIVLVLFLALQTIIFACNRWEKRAEPDIEPQLILQIKPPLKVDIERGLLKFSDLFSDFEIIPLETTEENLTGRAITIRIIGDRIYVCDKSGNKSIDVYTLDGDFLVRIQSVGRGPDEYIRIYDYDVDMVTGDVMILDGIANKGLLVFDANTGLYKKSIPLPPPGRFESFIKHGDKFLFHTGRGSVDDPESAMLYVSNEKGELLGKHLFFGDGEIAPLTGMTEAGGYNGRFYRTDDGIRLFCSWDFTVYSYSKGEVSRYLTLDISKFKPTQQMISAAELLPLLLTSRTGISQYTENNEFILLTLQLPALASSRIFYSKHSGRQTEFFLLDNDKTFTQQIGLGNLYKDQLITTYFPGWGIEGNDLIRDIRSGKIPMESEKAEELIDKMKRNTEQGGGASNPILILYELKME